MQVLKEYGNYMAAHLDKCKLESQGIHCYLLNEHMVSLYPLYANAIGGIQLVVSNEELEVALQLLNDSIESEEVHCPKCQSPDYYSDFKSYKSFKGIIALILTILFGIYPLYWENKRKCKVCNALF